MKTSCTDIVSVHQSPSQLYYGLFGKHPVETFIPGSGSNRVYSRLKAEGLPSVVAVESADVKENECFVGLSGNFRAAGHNVPEVYVFSLDRKCYLQQDLGDVSLLSCLNGPQRMELGRRALEKLVELQSERCEVWKESVGNKPFSNRQIMWDLNYFKYEFLKPSGILFDEEALEDDFENLANALSSIPESHRGFMYRDFQSRNIMVHEGDLWMIDFQGGRRGPLIYDAISFLWQSKANFSETEKNILFDYYATELAKRRNIEKSTILENKGVFALFRTLQVLGAYGFRGLVEKKSHFIESIPGAIMNLLSLGEEGVLEGYHEIGRISKELGNSRFLNKIHLSNELEVSVFSFSYKKGYPEDLSGNGGGFIFDCRGLPNPGRFERYKTHTGMDSDVKDFLLKEECVGLFIENAVKIVSHSVKTYIERGFKSLQIGFGCTGGRHRSVYCAENVSRMLKSLYPEARVIVNHREQNIVREYNIINNLES